jgi:hypothetical protein
MLQGALLLAMPLSQRSARILPTPGDVVTDADPAADSDAAADSQRLAYLTFLVMALGTALVAVINLIAGLVCTAVRGA